MLSWAVVLLAAVETVAAVEPGALKAPVAQLSYVRESGADACPTAAELREAVAARLGYDPFAGEGAGSVLARVRRSERGFVGSIELVDAAGHPHGERELVTSGESCEEMGQALALSISIAIAPERALVGPSAAPEAAAETAAAEAPTVTPPPAAVLAGRAAGTERPATVLAGSGPPTNVDRAAPRRGEPSRSRVQVSLAAVTLLGIAPSPALGGALTGQVRRGAWSLGAGARFARSASTAVREDVDLQATFAAGEASGCFAHAPFEHCALLLVGATWVQGHRVAVPRSDVGVFGAAAWRSSVVAPVSGRWALLVQLEAEAAFRPIHVQVDGKDVWHAPSVVGGLAAGARAHF